MNILPRLILFSLLAGFCLVPLVSAQTTEFTYQGSLQDGSNVANGNYDFEFVLYDALSGGAQIGTTISRSGVTVTNGIFAVKLDFGSQFTGANRFLEIHVRQAGGASFTPLLPRQQIGSTPYTIRTISAAAADALSSACVACVQDAQIATVSGNKVTGTVANATNASSFSGNLTGDVAGTQNTTVVNAVGGQSAASVATAVQSVNAATSNNTANMLVKRDGSGNFAAGTMTGNLVGNAASATNATNATNASSAATANALSGACVGCVQDGQIGSVGGGKITGSISSATIPGGNVSSTVANATNATNAANATNATTATNAVQLGGVAANQYVVTSDSRLTDSRVPTAGSANYIQNTTTQQASSNFNISGNGTFGGTSTLIHPTSGSGGLFIQNRQNTNYSQLVFLDDQGTYRGYTGYIGASAGLGSRNDTFELGSNGKDITFRPNESEVMRLTAGGNVGIGTTSPSSQLHVKGASPVRILGDPTTLSGNESVDFFARSSFFSSDMGGMRIQRQTSTGNIDTLFFAAKSGSSASEMMRITGDGNVGIGTTNPSSRLSVNGDVTVGTVFFAGGVNISGGLQLCLGSSNQISVCGSSLRYKKDVARFGGGLDIINRLRPIAFTWKQGGMRDVGLAAEEVAKVEPLLTFRNDKNEIEGVKYNQLSAVFVNAFKEQQAQIQAQQKQIDKQNAVNKKQQAELDARKDIDIKQQAELDALKSLVCLHHQRATVCKSRK